MNVRDYQSDAVENTWEYMSEMPGNPVIILPTGTGKSVVIGELCRQAVTQWDARVLVIAHRLELIQQNTEAIRSALPGTSIGIYSASAGSRDTSSTVVVAQAQSVHSAEIIAKFQRRDLVIIDEAHLVRPDDGQFKNIIDTVQKINPEARAIGTTATPFRLDVGPICSETGPFHDVAYEMTMREAIERGWLCGLVTKSGTKNTKADLSGVKVTKGDYNVGELSRAMRRGRIVPESVSDLLKISEGRRSGLVFCVDLDHVSAVAAELAAQGESVETVTGKTEPIIRAGIINQFRQGHIRWLVNCEVLTTGFNAPNTDVIALMRPTKSAGLYVQMVGRGTRLCDGKEDCLVADYAGLINTHGPVDLAKSTGSGGGQDNTRRCPECGEEVHVLLRECSCCGANLVSEKKVQCPDAGCGEMTSAELPFCQFCGAELPVREDEKDEPDLNTEASSKSILSSDKPFEDTEHAVGDVTYMEHASKTPGKPSTMRVMYWAPGRGPEGIFGAANRPLASEFICFNHEAGTFPHRKAGQWWRERSLDPVPFDVADAVTKAEAGALALPLSITLRKWRDKQWPEIFRVKLGEKPALEHDPDEVPSPSVPPSDDLPF